MAPKISSSNNSMPIGLQNLHPSDMHKIMSSSIIEVPDPITFIISPKYLNRPSLYPRQATLLKIIFLREDLFTEYDYQVVGEWTESFRLTGYNGLPMDILDRMRLLKSEGYPWFREVLLVMGRRAGKGHLSALAMSYVLWNYMAKPGGPQAYYGVDRDKKLMGMVFAGKREQAKAQVWRDIVNVVLGSTCFAPYVSQSLAEKLSIYAPTDWLRMREMQQKGLSVEIDMATFEIVPKESTLMAGRGPTSFMQCYDEMAHVVASGANRSAEEVYQASTPALDQFGKDAFIVEPSSPWQMMGQFYENYQHSLELNEKGTALYPEIAMVQLASWDIYVDWEKAENIPVFPITFDGDLGEYRTSLPKGFQPLRGAIQTFDESMKRLKQANPETFAVERESKFAAAVDAYLNEEKVRNVFGPWDERPQKYGPPDIKTASNGLLIYSYKGHADPSKVNDKFGIAVAHSEIDESGKAHCVFDLLHHFDPADFEDGIIDYEVVDDWIWDNVIKKFYPEEFTFDQYNSTSSIQKLQKRIRNASMPKRVNVFEKTSTRPYDWMVKENAKAAINLGLVHAPANERAELELRFLQMKNGRVDHPSSGPVQSKDIADAMMECIHVLIGEQVNNFVHADLSNFRPSGNLQGGMDPFPGMRKDPAEALSAFGKTKGNSPDRPDWAPSRSKSRQHRF